jgi:hypothetical protein
MLVPSGSIVMEAGMTQYVWQFGIIVIIVSALVATDYAQHQSSQIVIPALAGDSAIIRTAGGHVILIDTGNDAPKLLEFMGQYRRGIQRGVVDTVIITHPGAPWQGALHALILRGATHIIWLPASHADGHHLCTHRAVTCTFATTTDRWRIDDITIHVAGNHSLWVIWSSGQLLVAHNGLESVILPAPAQLTGLIYPWRIEPPLAVHRHAKVAFVLYSDGMHPAHAARRSMARRRVGNERLLHEDIDGDIYITLTHPLQLIRIPPP